MSDDDAIWKEFRKTVNMTASELEKWLSSQKSKSVGQKKGGNESTGHESGRRILAILKSKRADLAWTTTLTCAKSSATPSGTSRSGQQATSMTRPGDTR